MRITERTVGLAAVLAAGLLAAPASAEPLAVTTGLWEVTLAGSDSPLPMPHIPAEQLAKLTPEQQATLQQRMADAAAAAAKAPMVRKVCVTQATLEKGFDNAAAGPNCTRTVVSSTVSALEIGMACGGDRSATGSLKLQAVDAKTVTGSVDVTVTMKDGQTLPIHRVVQSRWLAADCGDVKPRE